MFGFAGDVLDLVLRVDFCCGWLWVFWCTFVGFGLGVLVVSFGLVLMFVCGLAQYTLDSSDFVGFGFGCFSVLASVLMFVGFAGFDAVLGLILVF